MLTTILNATPKSVLIEDSLSAPGKHVLLSLVRSHLAQGRYPVHVCLFEMRVERVRTALAHATNLVVHDFVAGNNGSWNRGDRERFQRLLGDDPALTGVVVVVDSLAHAVLEFGLAETCRWLFGQPDHRVVQALALLHADALPNSAQVVQCCSHLATLHLSLGPASRVHYRHVKSALKTVAQTEEYYFANGSFQTRCVDKRLLADTKPAQLPQDMSTFRIALDDTEKRSRGQLTLPYIKQAGGIVSYSLDDVDDWDEEDPDDDLDI